MMLGLVFIHRERVIWLWKNIEKIERIFTRAVGCCQRKFFFWNVYVYVMHQRLAYNLLLLEMVLSGGELDLNFRKALVRQAMLEVSYLIQMT